jgi:uncharacterized protein (UPF0210 family)
MIRSLTIHVPEDYNIQAKTYVNLLERFYEELEKKGYKVWTKRISLPVLNEDVDSRCKIIKDLWDVFGRYLVAGLMIDLENKRSLGAGSVIRCMRELNTLYSSLLIPEKDHEDHLMFLESFYREDHPDIFTRFAGVIGSWVLTPYFPSSPSIVDEAGISIALRYVDLVKKSFETEEEFDEMIRWIKSLDNDLLEISERLGVKYVGIDLSLSPWMEESVAELVERLSGSEIHEPGSASSIHILNKMIQRIKYESNVRTTGFNEVMLPLEEDNILKKRAYERKISLTTLLRLTPYCIAGLDMTVVSRRRFDIKRIVKDLVSTYEIKRKPLGFRVIPVNREAGDKISLGRFGESTVVEV